MEVQKNNLQSLLETKQRELDALREEFQTFKEETLEYEKELEADNQYKEKELEALKRRLETALAKSEEYRKEASQLEKILDREKENTAKIKAELELIRGNVVKMEQDNELFESKIRNLEFEKKEAKEKLEQLEEQSIMERETLTEKLNKSEEELERLRKELEEYKEEVAVLKKKNEEAMVSGSHEDAADNYAKGLKELQDKMEMLGKQVEEKDKVIADLQRVIKELTEELEKKNGLEKLKGELESREEEMKKMEKKYKEEICSLTADSYNQKEMLNRNTKKMGELEDEILNLKKTLEEKEDTIRLMNDNLANLTVELEIKESEAMNEDDEIENIKTELERLNKELRDAIREKQEMALKIEEEHTQTMDQLREFHEEQERAKLEKDKEIICLRLEVVEIKEELTAQKEENKKLREELSNKQGKVGPLVEDEASRLTNRTRRNQENEDKKIKLLQEEIEKLKEEVNNLKKENKKLKTKLGNKEKEVDQLEEEIMSMKRSIEEEKDKLLAIERDLEASRLEKLDLDKTASQNEIPDEKMTSPSASDKLKTVRFGEKLQSPEAKRSDLRVRSISPNTGLRNVNLTPVLEEVHGERSPEKSPERHNYHNKLLFKHLYAKIGKNGLPPYLVLDYDKKAVNIAKGSTGTGTNKPSIKLYKTHLFDSIVHRTSELNVKEIIATAQGGNADPQILGKNLFYMIYGPKKTDKKHLKYKMLKGFFEAFKSTSRKNAYADKVCKLIIRVQDNSINKKSELMRNMSFLQQVKNYREFELGNDKGEKELEDFLTQMEQIDKTPAKNVSNYTLIKARPIPKQIFIEFSIESSDTANRSKQTEASEETDETGDPKLNYSKLSDVDAKPEEGDLAQHQQPEYFVRTKIMLVCTNSVKEENYFDGLASIDSMIDLIMTDDRAAVIRKEKMLAGKSITDNVVKHFLLTTAPIIQNYKSTFNTLSLASKIDQLAKDRSVLKPLVEGINTHSRPYLQINRNLAKEMDQCRENKNIISPRKGINYQEKGSDAANTNEERGVEESEELNKKLRYFSKKQEMLKTNMKSVLGMLNHLISSNPQHTQSQKIKTERDREEEAGSSKKSPVNKNFSHLSRPTSTEKTPKAKKMITRLN